MKKKRFKTYTLIAVLIFTWVLLVFSGALYDENIPRAFTISILLILASFGIVTLLYKKLSQRFALVLFVITFLLSAFQLYGGIEELYCDQKGKEAVKASGYKEMILATEEDKVWLPNIAPGKGRVSPYWSGLRRCEESFPLSKIFNSSK